jgi:Domain of unknown function (DUF1844)
MPDKPFVINDRRKFTSEGELRPDAVRDEPTPSPTPAAEATPAPEAAAAKGPQLVAEPTTSTTTPAPEPPAEAHGEEADDRLPPPPTAEESAHATRAYDATVERLDTAIRATNPGMERIPEMNFERLVQSLYMQALLQLGGAAEPGQQPRVDLLGARQTIDMLAVIAEKTKDNLSEDEDKLLQSALFEARMGFLEVTQALARSAAAKQGGPPNGSGTPGFGGPGGGPSIVR